MNHWRLGGKEKQEPMFPIAEFFVRPKSEKKQERHSHPKATINEDRILEIANRVVWAKEKKRSDLKNARATLHKIENAFCAPAKYHVLRQRPGGPREENWNDDKPCMDPSGHAFEPPNPTAEEYVQKNVCLRTNYKIGERRTAWKRDRMRPESHEFEFRAGSDKARCSTNGSGANWDPERR